MVEREEGDRESALSGASRFEKLLSLDALQKALSEGHPENDGFDDKDE